MSKQGKELVYLNGKLVSKSEAAVSCFDLGVTHGWAVYEGIRVYDGKVVKLDEHIDRLFDSAKGALIEIPLTRTEFREAVIETVKANGLREAHIRPWVSHGERGGSPNVFIIARYVKSEMGKEVKAIVSAIRRTACDSIDAKIKTNSRLDLMLANEEAKRAGADYAIMLDKDGYVAEVSMANIFVAKGGKVFTPFTTNSLGGITRDTLMELLRDNKYYVEEKNMTFQDLYSSDEIFLCGTGAEIKAITYVDGRVIGDGKTGTITKHAIEFYLRFVKGEGEDIYNK